MTGTTPSASPSFLDETALIVAAFVSNNAVPASEIASLVASVNAALRGLSAPKPESKPAQQPAVPVKKSITPDYLVCLEDGKKFRSLKRHLRSKYQMTPDEYRAKWGLSSDYPMVAPNYSEQRSKLAKDMGLGQSRSAATRRAA